MFSKFIPFAVCNNIYEIDVSFFKKHGVKDLLVDLDNTLDSYKLFEPLEHAYELKKKLNDNGIALYVISNNKGNRVKSYATKLGVPFLASTHKPFSKRLKNFLKEHNISLDSAMFVGDQMMTDVLAAKGAGLRMVLCSKLVKEDQWTTHINRIFGKRIRKYLSKRGKLIDWRNK